MNTQAQPILVTGGTGTLGRQVAQLLVDSGRRVRVLSRHQRAATSLLEHAAGDLVTNQGIDAAVTGTAVIINCAGNNKDDAQMATNLVAAAKRAGAQHIVNISVVGAERLPLRSAVDRTLFGYFGNKREAEKVIEGSGVPWTNLRATQFYDLILTVAKALTKLPITPVPAGMRFQPVDSGEVAQRLVDLALADPAGQVPDLAGPRIYTTSELIKSYLQATHRRRLLIPIHLPGRAAQAIRDGANLAPNQPQGRKTWEEFLTTEAGGRTQRPPAKNSLAH